MSARSSSRIFANSSRQFTIKTPFQNRQGFWRRWQSTAAATEPAPPQNLFQRLWTSEVGIKTVHFWAPVMKWGVVLSGAADFLRPADKLSLNTNLALVATGTLWTRWCFIIRPKNVLLAAVNFCLAVVGTVQISRIFFYRRSLKGSSEGAAKDMKNEIAQPAKDLAAEAKQKI